jgi:hypothetical protein
MERVRVCLQCKACGHTKSFYHPVPVSTWEKSPCDSYWTPGCQGVLEFRRIQYPPTERTLRERRVKTLTTRLGELTQEMQDVEDELTTLIGNGRVLDTHTKKRKRIA